MVLLVTLHPAYGHEPLQLRFICPTAGAVAATIAATTTPGGPTRCTCSGIGIYAKPGSSWLQCNKHAALVDAVGIKSLREQVFIANDFEDVGPGMVLHIPR